MKLPIAAFLYDIYLASNVPCDDKFTDHLITQIAFDFLCHPDEMIDIEISEVKIEEAQVSTAVRLEDVIGITDTTPDNLLPAMATETGGLSLDLHLLPLGKKMKLASKPLYWEIHQAGKVIDKGNIFIKPKPETIYAKMPTVGPYTFKLRLEANGKVVARADRSAVRILAAKPRVRETVLGLSDEEAYAECEDLGGSLFRLPVQLRHFVREENGHLRTSLKEDEGRHPFERFPAELPAHTKRTVALFAMPRWVSRRNDVKDYYRYAPEDWALYGEFITWLAQNATAHHVGMIEV